MTPESAIPLSAIGSFGSPVGLFVFSFIGDKGSRKIPIVVMSLFTAVVLYFYFFHANSFAIMATMLGLFQVGVMSTSFMVMPYISVSFRTKMRHTASGSINVFGRYAVAVLQLFVPIIFCGNMAGVGIPTLLVAID